MDCSIPDCRGRAAKRGLCNKHYIRVRRFGRIDLKHPQKIPTVGNRCGGECRGAKRLRAHLDYLKKSDAYKARANKWALENADKKKQYFSRTDVLERMRLKTREWASKNRDRKKEQDKAFRQANRSLVTSYKAKYRASRRNATPSWLTEEHWQQIRAVYAEAERLTSETGIPHEVDHIVPLQGRTVCGLHVPWNLRAIPKVQNNRRPRVWDASQQTHLDGGP